MDNLNFNNLIQIEDNLYCVNDIAEKLILSKNVKEYIKKISNKKWIKGNYYISKDDMLKMLSKCKTVIGQQYLNFINSSDKPIENKIIEKDTTKHITTKEELQAKVDNRKFIDHGTNEIIYNNNKIIFFEYNEILYLRAKDVCDFLGYNNAHHAIITHVEKEETFTFDLYLGNRGSKSRPSFPNNIEENDDFEKSVSQITIPYDNTSEFINQIVPQKEIEKLKKIKLMIEQKTNKFIDPKTVFINESGLYSLIIKSKMPEATKFRIWVTNDVLVSIRKTGSYNRVHNGPLYDEVKLKELENIPCVYIIHVKDSLYKFGQTKQPLRRMIAHKSNLSYNEIIKIFEFPILDLAINVENRIKKYTINAKIRKYLDEGIEFFEINKDYSIERILKDISAIVDNEISIHEKKSNSSKLDSLAYIENIRLEEYDKLILIEQEKSKQADLEIRKQELDIRKLELEIELFKLKENKQPQPIVEEVKEVKEVKEVIKYIKHKTKKCIDCNYLIYNQSTRCHKCLTFLRINTAIQINNRPTLEQLEAELINDTYINVAKKYGVSDNTIRNWIKQYKKII